MTCNHASTIHPQKEIITKHTSCGRGTPGNTVKKRKLIHRSDCKHLKEMISTKFRTQKSGIKNATVTQWRTGKHLCLVQVWADIVTRLESYLGPSDDTPVNTVWVENHKTTITSQMKIKSMSSGTLSFEEEHLGLSHKKVGTHSLL